jgi:hypothetical protein
VTDIISQGQGIIKEMKKDGTNVSQLLDLVCKLKDGFKTELEEKDPHVYKEMEAALDLIRRLTNETETAKSFCSNIDNVKKLCSFITALNHIPELTATALQILDNFTCEEGNLENCKKGGCADAILDLADDESGDLPLILRLEAKIIGDMARLPELKELFGKKDITNWIFESLSKYSKDGPLQTTCSYATKNLLAKGYEPNIQKVLGTKNFQLATNYLAGEPENTDCARFVCDSIIECIDSSPQNKAKVNAMKLGPKIVEVLKYYSKKSNYDPEIVQKCLYILGCCTQDDKNNKSIVEAGIMPALCKD